MAQRSGKLLRNIRRIAETRLEKAWKLNLVALSQRMENVPLAF
jgi:hypothetical protein